ncbi:hypothetical protein [Methanolobus sp. WCC5]|uniref:hypothetical protein n=1 Tax=Methanolobus sp. WCC5 TaxID=3125785 RepID=UPI003251F1E8
MPSQHEDLKRIFWKYDVLIHPRPVLCAKEVIDLMHEYRADDLFVVLPQHLVEELVEHGVRPIKSQMHRKIHSDGEVEFVHEYFYRVEEFVIKRTIL